MFTDVSILNRKLQGDGRAFNSENLLYFSQFSSLCYIPAADLFPKTRFIFCCETSLNGGGDDEKRTDQ